MRLSDKHRSNRFLIKVTGEITYYQLEIKRPAGCCCRRGKDDDVCCRPRVSIDEAVASGRKSTYRERTKLAFGLESGEGARAEPAEGANSHLHFFGNPVVHLVKYRWHDRFKTTTILFKLKKMKPPLQQPGYDRRGVTTVAEAGLKSTHSEPTITHLYTKII